MLFAVDLDGTVVMERRHKLVPAKDSVHVLSELAKEAKLIYVTCRAQDRKQESIDWLTQHGFPNASQVHCCKHYRYKYHAAFEQAAADDQVTLIDDLFKEVFHGFRQIARDDLPTAKAMSKRLCLVGYGMETLPDVGIKIPFPTKALPSWRWLVATTTAMARNPVSAQTQAQSADSSLAHLPH